MTPRLRFALTALAGLTAMLLVMEVALRTWIVSPSATPVYQDYGWTQAPGTLTVYSREGYSVSRTNSLGLHDDQVGERGPVRVLLMGDSYSQALQMPRERNMAKVAQQLGAGLEVINSGRAGQSMIDHAAYIGPLTDLFAPDVVVIQVNDGEIRDLNRSGMLGLETDEVLERFMAREPHRIPTRGLTGVGRWFARRSALLNFLYRRTRLLARTERQRLHAKFAAPAAVAAGTPDVDPRLGPLMDGLYGRVAARADSILLVYIPALHYTSAGCENAYPERRAFYRDFARRHGVALIDASEPFCEEYVRTGRPSHGFQNSIMGDGHINARGHRILGELIAARLAGGDAR